MCHLWLLFRARFSLLAGLLLIPGHAAFGTTPVPINSYAAEDSGHDQIYLHPTAADGRGNWVTVWQDTPNTRVLASTSTDDATSWSAPVVVSDSDTTGTYIAYPELATDRAGTWMAVWADKRVAGTLTGADADIFYARSLDNGVTWSPPAPLNSNAAGDAGADALPTLACDSNGNWLVVWHSDNPPSGTLGTEWDIWSAGSTDGGLTWSTASPLNTNAAEDLSDDFLPLVAAAGSGTWLVAWKGRVGSSTSTSTPSVVLSRSTDRGETWSAPAVLSPQLNAYSLFSLAATPDGNAITAFTARPWDFWGERSIYTVRSQDAGQNWSQPELFMPAPAGSTVPRFAPGENGVWISVWVAPVIDSNDSGWRSVNQSVSTDAGASWTRSSTLAYGYSAMMDIYGFSQRPAGFIPTLASNGRDRWVCLFTFSYDPFYHSPYSPGIDNGGDLDLFSVVTDIAPRSQPTTASYLSLVNRNGSEDAGDDLSPAIAADAQGRRVAVWQSNDNLYGSKGTDTDILVSRSTDSNQTWTSPTLLQPSGASDSSPDTDPAIATDSRGTWLALWTTSSTLTGGWHRIVSSLSTDAGQTWSAPQLVNPDALVPAESREVGVDIETDGLGNWVATWEQYFWYGSYTRMARSQNNGATWTAAQRAEIGESSKIATDGTGTWIVAHQRELCDRGGCELPELRLARSTDHGDTWTTGLTPFPDRGARTPDVAFVSNTWMLVWENELEPDPDGDPDVDPGQLGIRSSISTDGGLTWSEPQVVSLDAATTPRVIPEGPGRWLCVWSSTPYSGFLSSERDLLYARSTDNGQSWSEPVRMNGGPTYNDSPAIALDGQGRPVIAWSGKNSTDAGSDYDIWFATSASSSFTGAADWQLFE